MYIDLHIIQKSYIPKNCRLQNLLEKKKDVFIKILGMNYEKVNKLIQKTL